MSYRTNLPLIDFSSYMFTNRWTVLSVDWFETYSQAETASGLSCFSRDNYVSSDSVLIRWRYRSEGWNLDDFNYCRAQLGLDGLRYGSPEIPPPFSTIEVILETSETGHPIVGGIRFDEIFSECFQQDNQLGDGRYVFVETDFAKANHAECMTAAQIIINYKDDAFRDFEQWQVSALPFLAAFFMLYIGYKIGNFRG